MYIFKDDNKMFKLYYNKDFNDDFLQIQAPNGCRIIFLVIR